MGRLKGAHARRMLKFFGHRVNRPCSNITLRSHGRSRDLRELGVYVFLKYLSSLFMGRVKMPSI